MLDTANRLLYWEMTGIRLTVPPTAALPDGYLWAGAEALTEQYALPSAFRAIHTQF